MRTKAFAKRYFLWIAAILAITGCGLVLAATPLGAGLIDWDSFNYVSTARSLAEGLGLRIPVNRDYYQPMTHYPPLFSILLSLPVRLGADPLQASRWMNALAFGGSIFLAGCILYKATDNVILSLGAALLYTFSPTAIGINAWVLAEPLLTLLLLGGSLVLILYLEEGRWWQLVLAALLFSAGFLTKYVGAAGVGATALYLLLRKGSGWRKRLGEQLVVWGIGLVPSAIWAWRNFQISETLNNRNLGFHPPAKGNFISMFHTLASWLLPEGFIYGHERGLAVAAAVVLVGVVAWGISHHKKLKSSPGLFLETGLFLLSLALAYLFVVFFSKTFVDDGIGMTTRMFAPLLPLGILLGVITLNMFWQTEPQRLNRMLVLLVSGLMLVSFAAGTALKMPSWRNNGLGLARPGILDSPALEILKSEELRGQLIYSNNPYALYLLTGDIGYRIKDFPSDISTLEGKPIWVVNFAEGGQSFMNNHADELQVIEEDSSLSLSVYVAQNP